MRQRSAQPLRPNNRAALSLVVAACPLGGRPYGLLPQQARPQLPASGRAAAKRSPRQRSRAHHG
eukprot:1518622-Alexandrium_andersonii.AAC.1